MLLKEVSVRIILDAGEKSNYLSNWFDETISTDIECARDGRADTDPHPEKNLSNGGSTKIDGKAAGDHAEDVTTATTTTIAKKVRSFSCFDRNA